MPEYDYLVDVRNLKTYFYTEDGVVPAVDRVSLRIKPGETLGVVGESGCGKSVTSLSIMRLIQQPPGKILEGEIFFKGENLLLKPEDEMRKVRGGDIAMIFQEPMTSLNPVYTVGDQVSEAIILHQELSKKDAIDKVVQIFKLVGISDAERRVNSYPHQMSGGMRQRVMIAMALSCNPDLLIADEPTTALDVTIQAQILELMKELKARLGMAIMLVTHNLGVVAEMAQNIMVMYAGKVVEYATAREIFKTPQHPYSYGLLYSVPRLDRGKSKEPLLTIEGVVPNPYNMPPGCRFHPRCKFRMDSCDKEEPPLISIDNSERLVACWLFLHKGKQDFLSEGGVENG
ncbi:MAG: Oligopeptide transport ATP-binding protein OppD [candidate division WS2 bacterium]|nr:Oligopeptide transport ATP-binding protein OppD [Candidatus Lithacetigena glycinireducens]MBT9174748.1 Oligopeptide transport ATP-binding protein OppD [Candidatus Lithacetigena glycinireducens]